MDFLTLVNSNNPNAGLINQIDNSQIIKIDQIIMEPLVESLIFCNRTS